MRDMLQLVPMVVEQSARGERSFDIYSRLLRGHEMVAVQGPFHVRFGAPAMLGIEPDDAPLGFLHFGGMDQDVGRLALEAAEWLMHVKARIGQRGAVPMHSVCTGALMNCMVSYIARPLVTTPP